MIFPFGQLLVKMNRHDLMLPVMRNCLQLRGGGWDVLRDLGEAQIGAVHHVRFTAALGWADRLVVAFVVQPGVFCA